jgi:thymidylate synthase (FAD)
MGNDLTVVNSARVSFGKRKTKLDEGDKKLINYLAKNKHWSPFRHISIQFHIKAPEIVGRQFYKHIIGSEYSFKDQAWNEKSLRYVVLEEEFYVPSKFRKQSSDNKQASTNEEVDNPEIVKQKYNELLSHSYDTYKSLLELGVAREQARGVLPVSFYTEWIWSASLQAICNFIKLRDDPHSQWEIRQYALAMKEMAQSVCPVAFDAVMEHMD